MFRPDYLWRELLSKGLHAFSPQLCRFYLIASGNVLGQNWDDHKRLTSLEKGQRSGPLSLHFKGWSNSWRNSMTIAAFLVVALFAFLLAFQEPRIRRRH